MNQRFVQSNRGQTQIIAVVIMLYLAVNLISIAFMLYPVVTTTGVSIVVAVTAFIGVHAWYTRRSFTESVSVFITPLQISWSMLWRVGEFIRRDSPPTETTTKEDNSKTPIDEIKTQYATGEIETVHGLEKELEEQLSD